MSVWKRIKEKTLSIAPNRNKNGQAADEIAAADATASRVQAPSATASSGTAPKGFNPFRSVGAKLFIMFMVSIVVLVSVTGFYSYNTSKDTITDEVSAYSEQAIVQASQKLDLILNKYIETSMQFLTDAEFQDIMLLLSRPNVADFERFQTIQRLGEKLGSVALSDKSINAVYMFDEEGTLISQYGSIQILLSQSVKEESWFVEAIEGNGRERWVTETPEMLLSNGKPTFGITRELNYSGVTAVLYIDILRDPFNAEISKLQLGASGQTHLITPDGTVLFGNVPDMIGKAVDSVQLDPERAVAATGEVASYSYESDGNLVILANQSAVGWQMLGIVPIEELTENAGKILNGTLAMIAIAVLISIVVGYVMVHLIARPLVKLRNLMNEGERGNLAVRTTVKSKDEIGQVSESFNRMMEQISGLVQQTNRSAQEVLDMATNLTEVSKNTAMAAKEISVATEQIASGASTLAVEAERGNEITQHIGQQMQETIKSNLEMGKAAAEVRGVSQQGTEYMGELIQKTSATEVMTRQMVQKVDMLKESTSSVRKILDVLSNMTKQTNILSLNATIEAARAGAAGKGFMVVADEIRKLADQSKQNIAIVADITDKIQSEIEETVSVLSEAYPLFQEQISSVKQTDLIFKNVSGEMEAFVQKLDSVTQSIQTLEKSQATLSEAMANVSAVSEESSATSEEVASLSTQQLGASDGLVELAEKLETLSKSLKESLARFTI